MNKWNSLKEQKKCGDGWWHLGNCCINLQCIKQQFRLQDATSLKKGGHRRTMSPFKEKDKWACVCVCVCRGDEEREGERERNSLPTKKCGNEIFENYQNTIFVVMI